jgi:undecaprenyl-diphosphatase
MTEADRNAAHDKQPAADQQADKLHVTTPEQADRVLDDLERAGDDNLDHEAEKPAQQTQSALEEAIAAVKTPEQADRVLDDLEQSAGNATEREVAQRVPKPANANAAAQSIQQAADAPADIKPQAVIAQAAAQIAAADEEDEEPLARGVQQAVSPEVFAVQPPANEEERRLLQEALLRRLRPLSAADAAVFLTVNRMPHPPAVNSFMYSLTTLMNRGDGWWVGLCVTTLHDRRRGKRAMLDVLPALWLATATVEFPIKRFFRRRRPFIALVQAIVIGKKPGHFSFPSGHSAASFAGAWLISRHFPRLTPLLYAIASLVGFSRVYLGAHYPGDVLSGATFGVVLASIYRHIIEEFSEELTEVLDD